MTNDVHSRIARVRALRSEQLNFSLNLTEYRTNQINLALADLAKSIADDAEKMLGLLLEAREKDNKWVLVECNWVEQDGPLGKKIAEFLEGK